MLVYKHVRHHHHDNRSRSTLMNQFLLLLLPSLSTSLQLHHPITNTNMHIPYILLSMLTSINNIHAHALDNRQPGTRPQPFYPNSISYPLYIHGTSPHARNTTPTVTARSPIAWGQRMLSTNGCQEKRKTRRFYGGCTRMRYTPTTRAFTPNHTCIHSLGYTHGPPTDEEISDGDCICTIRRNM